MTSVRTVLVVGGGTAGATLRRCWAAPASPWRSSSATRTSPLSAPASPCKVPRCACSSRSVCWTSCALMAPSSPRSACVPQMAASWPRTRHRPPWVPTARSWRSCWLRPRSRRARRCGSVPPCRPSPRTTHGVDVVFSDGDTGRYDLLVGADGVRSATRSRLGIEAEVEPVGMGIWRVHARRPAEVDHSELCYDGPCYIAGFTPTGPDTLYAYLVEAAQNRFSATPRSRKSRQCANSAAPLSRPVGADPRGHHRRRADQLHLVRAPAHRRRVEPRPGRRHRRRRAHLPTHPGSRARRWRLETPSVLAELLLTRDRSTRSCSTRSWPAGCRAQARW